MKVKSVTYVDIKQRTDLLHRPVSSQLTAACNNQISILVLSGDSTAEFVTNASVAFGDAQEAPLKSSKSQTKPVLCQ